MRYRAARAFTLIELLVVLVIMGIVVGAVVLQITNADRNEHLRNAISGLKNRTSYTQQRALLRNELLGMSVSLQGYRFYHYVKKQNRFVWQVLDESPLQAQLWPKDTQVTLALGNASANTVGSNYASKPDVVFLQTGVISPFRLVIDNTFYLQVNAQGQLESGRENAKR